MSRAAIVFALLCVTAAPSRAQAPKSIDPGMSEAKVVERIGQPDASRAAGDFKYLFYHNNCIKQCGMDDVVILQKDSVVDAMFRSAERTYTGKSSSPRSIPADVAARTRPAPRETHPSEVVQAGSVKPEPAPKPDTPAEKADSTAKKAPAEQPVAPKSEKKAQATNADTARRDTTIGRLRIPVKPQHHSMVKPDSTRSDSAQKKAPHEE